MLRATDKSAVYAGVWQGRDIVAKVLTTGDPYWQAQWRREAVIYRLLAATPPVPVPAVYHDGDGIRILERIAGPVMHPDRYPTESLPALVLESALAAFTAIGSWSPAAPLPDTDYPALHSRYRTHLPAAVNDRLTEAFTWRLPKQVFQHGDPLPSNILIREGECAVIDWEHAGSYLPGYDLAVLACVLSFQPGDVRAVIDAAVAGLNGVSYAINLALVAARERHVNLLWLPDCEQRRARLAAVDEVAAAAAGRLAALMA